MINKTQSHKLYTNKFVSRIKREQATKLNVELNGSVFSVHSYKRTQLVATERMWSDWCSLWQLNMTNELNSANPRIQNNRTESRTHNITRCFSLFSFVICLFVRWWFFQLGSLWFRPSLTVSYSTTKNTANKWQSAKKRTHSRITCIEIWQSYELYTQFAYWICIRCVCMVLLLIFCH